MIYTSPYPPIEVPECSLAEYILDRLPAYGDRSAFVDAHTGRAYSFAELEQYARRLATGMAAHGIGRGDVVAICSPNLPEYPIVFLATAMLGAALTTSNPLYTPEELAFQFDDAGAKMLFTIELLLPKVQAAHSKTLNTVVVIGDSDAHTTFGELLTSAPMQALTPVDPRTDIVALPYSSGTTGKPKGVMLTHHNLVANLSQAEGLDDTHTLSADSVVIGVLPFFHIYGLMVMMTLAPTKGARVVTLPRFDMDEFLKTLQDHRVTSANLVPPILLGLAKLPQVSNYDLSALEVIGSGAAPLAPSLAAEVSARLDCVVTQGYGLTETSPITHINPSLDPAALKVETIGRLVPNTEARLVDTHSGADLTPAQCADGASGELWIRGPQVMAGYLNNPQATAETIDADGWLHTGDIATVDTEGYFTLVDRVKELIKYKGFQVAPAELEALLVSHPDISDAAVIGSPDTEAGEVPKAVVVCKTSLSDADIMDFVAQHVAPHKKIRLVERVAAIPKAASGKILRRELLAAERARVAAASTSGDHSKGD